MSLIIDVHSYKQLASVLLEAAGAFGCKWGDVMMSAAEINDTEALSRALALAGSVNIRDSGNGCTATHRAVRCSSFGALSALLAAGADCTIKDNVGCSSFTLAVLHDDPHALKMILDSMETSTFCSLLNLQSIGLFESLESSCQTFAEKFLGLTNTSDSNRLNPPALSLLVWRLPAAAIMGLDTDSLSHFVVLCCFFGCEHSAKSIISRRPSVSTCVHSQGLSLLHIAVVTASRSISQLLLLAAESLVNSQSNKAPPSLTGKHLHLFYFIFVTLLLFLFSQAAWTPLCTWRVLVLSMTRNAALVSCCLLGLTPSSAILEAANLVICC
jgi:hypothetical protein